MTMITITLNKMVILKNRKKDNIFFISQLIDNPKRLKTFGIFYV
jgi:hypothetical protein